MLVEVAQLGEAERLIERHPLVELADLDVADDVVDAFETDRRAGRFGREIGRHVARAVVAEVVAAVDEGVLRLAVRADRGEAQRALVVGQLVRLAHRAGTAGEGRLVGRRRVVDDERQVLGAVTVLAHVAPDRRVGREARGDDETDVALFEQVRRDVVTTGLGPGVGRDPEPERRGEEPRRGARVADVELERVPPLQVGCRSERGAFDGGHARCLPDRSDTPAVMTTVTDPEAQIKAPWGSGHADVSAPRRPPVARPGSA